MYVLFFQSSKTGRFKIVTWFFSFSSESKWENCQSSVVQYKVLGCSLCVCIFLNLERGWPVGRRLLSTEQQLWARCSGFSAGFVECAEEPCDAYEVVQTQQGFRCTVKAPSLLYKWVSVSAPPPPPASWDTLPGNSAGTDSFPVLNY